MLKDKKILIGITGSIAAYKSIILVRLLVKAGATVKVILTPAAKDFVTPLTLSTLTKNPVLSNLFDEESWANHVMLGRWADLMLIAPLSCNTIAKMAHGICDNLLMATYLSATCPVILAPAMDEDMWHHPSTVGNLEKLKQYGNTVIPVQHGELASGLYGEGRMAEPEAIVEYLQDFFLVEKVLNGRKALVTAGPTYEPIDPVRFIGNHSSGKMGYALAEELHRRGAEVTLIMGPSTIQDTGSGIRFIKVRTAEEMYEASLENFGDVDIAILSAAVADYTPVVKADEKIKKKDERFTLELMKTKDILKSLGDIKQKQVLVGFALETHNERAYALEKLEKKNADMIVLNSLNDEGAGFGKDTNRIHIFDKSGKEYVFGIKSKKEVAKDIVDTLISTYYA
ncbi:MAG: bifunctional phosphopantothenoylcysteine decarboxylase/phosphopantothenate--cysteine ligase CoaBC [Terrimonas sp.]|nr:bifunctional phosphopantothenoylcysteine decarboxylase/phosphopantothenate--cysteine ligase CoaBC [Terrimonas sp.]